MRFGRDLKPSYIYRGKEVGEVLFADGKVDVTDPGYDRDTWCALYDVPVEPGMYKALTDVMNFPSEIIIEDDSDALLYGGTVGSTVISDDHRIVCLTIIHEDYIKSYNSNDMHMYRLGKVGVDAGLCGFYNHKPDYPQDEWLKFCDNLEENEFGNTCDCHHGVTVSSGFGDGFYAVDRIVIDRKTVGLQLWFW